MSGTVAAAIAALVTDGALLEALIGYLPVGVVVTNPVGEMVTANATARALERSETVGREIVDVVLP